MTLWQPNAGYEANKTMTLHEIRDFPTTIDTGPNSGRVHESVLRSYQIVQKVKELLGQGVPPEVLLEIIGDLEGAMGSDYSVRDGSCQITGNAGSPK